MQAPTISLNMDDHLADGSSRHVFAPCPTYVVKVGRNGDASANASEVEKWLAACDGGWSYLLAPILAWADDFSWIMQERCTTYEVPEDMPSECVDMYYATKRTLERKGISDLHFGNFGVSEFGSLVCLDYAG